MQEVRLHEVDGEGELWRAQKVQDVMKEGPVTINEVVSLWVSCCGQVSTEHGTQHGVWVALKSGHGGGVQVPTNI